MSYNAFKTVMEIDAHGTFNVTKAVFDASMQQHGGSVLNISATLHYKGDLLQAHAGAAKAAIGTRGLGRPLATTSAARATCLTTTSPCSHTLSDGLTRHLANAWGELGIRVNCVAPGPIADTEGYRRLGAWPGATHCACTRAAKLTTLNKWFGVPGHCARAAGGFMPKEYIDKWVKQGIPVQRLGTRRDIGDAALFLCSDAASYVTGVVLVVDGGAWFRPPDGGASEAMMQSKL